MERYEGEALAAAGVPEGRKIRHGGIRYYDRERNENYQNVHAV